MASTQRIGVLLEKYQIHVSSLWDYDWITLNDFTIHVWKTDFAFLIFRNDGKMLGKRLQAIGELLTYHGMVLESKINDSFQVMDEEAGRLVTDFSKLDGKIENPDEIYEHQN